jgi:signal transduction histidine kinase
MPRPEAVADAEGRVLIYVKGAHEASVTLGMLEGAGLHGHICRSLRELRDGLEVVEHQPPWSDFPFIVFTALAGSSGVHGEPAVGILGNVALLDRPVHVRTMLAAVRAAVRARHQQYKARAAIEARDAFLAMLGHELRNPLGAISLAISAFNRAHPELGRKEPAIIERQVHHLARLVDDLLDVARVERGKIALKTERVDLVETVRVAFQALALRAEEQGLSFVIESPTTPLWVRGDPQRLEQVLSNILTNAIKYTPAGGTVRVVVTGSRGWAEVRVVDTGIGIDPEMRAHVFDVFTQADQSLDRAQGGLGLGLAIAESVVHLHGGTVSVESAGLGHGATFVVRLPCDTRGDSSRPAASAAPSEPPLLRRIVVVEDNSDNRELMVDILTGAGHRVESAGDGPEGLDRILSFQPDIAFVDIGLPGFDGFELARRARKSGYQARLVALTGYGQRDDRRRSFEAGFNDHLTKPISERDLDRAVGAGSHPTP